MNRKSVGVFDLTMNKILFVCVHNSGRSQMAEAFFNRYAGPQARASSAGTLPASDLNHTVMEAMKEMGMDISQQRPKPLTTEMVQNADRVITMGCGVEEACPVVFVPVEDWQLEDPEGKPIQKVREIRDEIEAKVKKLVEEIRQE
ncbi:MAG: arsenate reductase ArsC [Dehalococcoidia bacterium]